ncbi:MAG: S8 family serine peptidase, partial [Bilophila sp.]
MAIIRPVVGHNSIGTGGDDQFRTLNTMAAVGLAGDDMFHVLSTGAHYWYGGSGNDTYKANAFSEIVIFEDAASPWDTLNISSESAQFLRFAIVNDRHLLISGFATTFIADFMSPRGKIGNFQIMDEQQNIVIVSLDTMWAKYIASAPHITSSLSPQLTAKLALRGQATVMEQTLPGFNENYYLTHNADIAAAVANGDLLAGAAHYAMNGGHEGRSPNPVYDEHFYMANPTFQAAVLGAGMTGYEHYVHYGQYEGLQPSAIYNDAAYLAANPDVQQAVTTGFLKTGFEHYAQSGQYEGRALAPGGNAPLVAVATELDTADAPAALAHTPFAAASAVTTLDSTVLQALASSMLNAEASSEPNASASSGLLTVADPNAPAWFDETVYLQSKLEQLQRSHEGTYATVDQVQQAIVDAGMTPYAHYVRYGEAEGVSPNAYFNPVLYARALAASWNSTQHNGTDVWNETDPLTFAQKMGVTLYEHFSAKGDSENINPSNTFDVSAYLEAKGQHCGLSPEATLQAILAAGLDPLTHYLHYGKAEGIPVGVVPTSEAVFAQTWWNPLPQDPLFGDQWHLLNTGQEGGTPGMDLHIVPAWHDYTGKGVTVGVVDTGVEFTHPDLSAHIDTDKSFGAVTDPKTHIVYDKHGEPIFNTSETVQSPDSHGMPVAGLVGALANDLGGVGVAPDSTIASIYIALGVEPSPGHIFGDTTNFNRALQQADNYDILTNSWGNLMILATTYATPDEYRADYADLHHAVSTGRDDLGTVVLVAAGNSSGIGADANLETNNCTPFTITVGGVDYKGQPVSYATPGANVLVSAPTMTQEWTLTKTEEEPHVITQNKGDITTTDRQGAEGYAPSDY